MTDDERADSDSVGDSGDPFADLEVPDSDASTDELFERVGPDSAVSDVDISQLLDEGEAADLPAETAETVVDRDALDAVEQTGEGCIVPKSRYCERCEHLSDPPTVACRHDGTTIHELVDTDHVLVSECPVVAERGRVDTDSER